MKDKKAVIFYFLMSLVLVDFGNQLRKISYNSFFEDFSNPIFSIIHTTNTGSAFSLFENHSQIIAYLGILILLFIILYVIKNIKLSDRTELLSITLFTAGTLGNIIERLTYGHVVDYIKLNFINFPIFNTFDIMICIGIILYTIFVLFFQKKEINE